jgi:RimJ/RimL family protein N-acetyltransferase
MTTTNLTTERLVLRMWSEEERTAVLAVAVTADDDGNADGEGEGERDGDGAGVTARRPAHWADDFPDEGDRIIAEGLGRFPGWMGPHGHRQIVERASGLVIGGVGLFWPPIEGEVEIGYGIVPSRQGRGYATEAAIALTDFALALPEVRTVYANVDLPNRASVRVLVKADFRHWRTEGSTASFRRGAASDR